MKLKVISILLLLTLSACKNTPKEQAQAQPAEPAPKEAPAPTPAAAPAANAMKPHVSSIPPTMNQMLLDQEIPDVSLEITSPQDNATIDTDTLEVTFDLKNYRIDRELGQHIHVILDNDPYLAHYDADKPLVIKNLKPGTHTLRAFPARHYHLSLKKGDVFKTITFHVKQPSKDFAFDKSKPYLTYSRPKGTYPTAAAQVGLLLDYYVTNTEIGPDTQVVYGVDGQEVTQQAWKPVILPPMSAGEHTITLKLVDANGQLIPNGGYNNTTRKITVQ